MERPILYTLIPTHWSECFYLFDISSFIAFFDNTR
jgi:hypothetical protein